MATVFAPPEEVGEVPDLDEFMEDLELPLRACLRTHEKAETAWVDRIAVLAREQHKGDVIGEVIRFPQGDGYALYVVWNTNPCELVWLPVGDAWRISEAHERGLRTQDVRQMVRSERSLRALFGNKK